MVLVTSFSAVRPKFTNRKIKGDRIYICNINKIKLLYVRKFGLYPAETKQDNYTKIESLFKYCFYYKFKCHSKTSAFPRNLLIFLPTNFLVNIVFHWTVYNHIYIIIPSTSIT